jgi:Na+/proline symporter
MKRFTLSLLCAIGGYLVSAVLGYYLIGQFSSNTHDRSVEAAMTAAFVFGPLGAVIAFVVGFIFIGRTSRPASMEG